MLKDTLDNKDDLGEWKKDAKHNTSADSEAVTEAARIKDVVEGEVRTKVLHPLNRFEVKNEYVENKNKDSKKRYEQREKKQDRSNSCQRSSKKDTAARKDRNGNGTETKKVVAGETT